MRALKLAFVVLGVSLLSSLVLAGDGMVPSGARIWLTPRIHGSVGHTDAAGRARYIVQFRDAPVPLYTGSITGLRATTPRVAGVHHLDVRAPRVRAYVNYLTARHADFLQHAQNLLHRTLEPHFQYHYALNGMSVSLNRAEATRLRKLPQVLSVQLVQYHRPTGTTAIPATSADTAPSRAWINAPAVWSLPIYNNLDDEGEGIVLADLDTGINSANASFAAIGPKDGYVAQNPLGSGHYLGVCDQDNATDGTLADAKNWPQTYNAAFHCNDKLIGAYTYTLASGHDPHSPEDSEGHGSHTASTAAGNFVDVNLASLGITSPISGVAPHASIIAYDICDPTDSCGSDAAVAAVDQAIKDYAALLNAPGFKGMVMNYSIGGEDSPYSDPVEQAFLSAAAVGIYVSASGGNGGPGNAYLNDPSEVYPVEHLAPWVATVAASTHDGSFSGNNVSGFTGGDAATRANLPTSIAGLGETGALALTAMIYAGDGNYNYTGYPTGSQYQTGNTYPVSGEAYADPTQFAVAQATAECLYPFPAGTFPKGSLVVCDRGDIPLVDKADNVKQGGAGGIVIVSQADNALIAEPYEIPGSMIANADGLKLEAWLKASVGAATPAQGRLSGATLTHDSAGADQLADFSSRGPNNSVYDSVIKPDLTAPGVSILAAVANPVDTVAGGADQPETYAFYDGTSMASPHDAGAAALLKQRKPGWSPAEIKSALMLTAVTQGMSDQCASLDASNNCVFGTAVPSPQARGAGRIDVDAASRTGLLLDETEANYKAANPATGGDLTQLNLASLGNNNCIQTCTWTRTVTSAFINTMAHYTVSAAVTTGGPTVTVSPASFDLGPGATQTLSITADVSKLPYGQWAYTQIDIASTDKGDDGQPIPDMHLPLAVLPEPPVPIMSLSPSRLAFSVMQTKSAIQTLTVGNSGRADLNWSLSTDGGSQTNTLWDQPDNGSGSGIASGYFSPDTHGVYGADRFVMPVQGTLTKIVADGFAQDGSGPIHLSTATAIAWYIYADQDGQPAGNPDDGLADYTWHFQTLPTGAGVDTTDGDITLDLTAAGQSAVSLSAGTYWLVVAPTFNARISDPNGAAWYWLEGTSSDGTHSAMSIDPSDAFGGGVTWTALQDSLAFTLTGTLDCGSGSLAGLSFSEQSGKVTAGSSSQVTVTFDAGNTAAGNYTAGVCVAGDDPAHPLEAVPISITVTEAPHSSGGGLGLIGLLVLGLLGWRQQRG